VIAAAVLGLLVLFTSSIGSEKYFALVYLVSLASIVGIAFARPVEQEPSLAFVFDHFQLCDRTDMRLDPGLQVGRHSRPGIDRNPPPGTNVIDEMTVASA
jgi:hypothetical protein